MKHIFFFSYFKSKTLFQNEPILLDHFINIIKNLPSIPTKIVTNFLINDLLTYCNKSNIDLEEW